MRVEKTIQEKKIRKYKCYLYGVWCYGTVDRPGNTCPVWHVGEVFEKWIQPANYKKTWWNQVEKE